MCHYDLEMPSCSTVSRPVARKRHHCEECGHPILPGRRYVRTTGVWDHRPDSHAQHEDCAALLRHIADAHCDGVWVFGDLASAVSEHAPDEPALTGRWADILRARESERTGGVS